MLRLILDGEPGTIRFEAFLRAMAAMLDGVRDVDRALSGGDRLRLDWVLDRLENSSAGAVVRDRPGGDVPPKHGLRVRARFVRQLRVLAERAGVPPRLHPANGGGARRIGPSAR